MIAGVRGTLEAQNTDWVILAVGGFSVRVYAPLGTITRLPGLGQTVHLATHLYVREDQIALYGFLRLADKLLFEKLLTVSGIGPKLAITILSGMPADEMVGSIRGNDVARLTRIPGIGRKTAERMVLELRDKLPPAPTGQEVAVPSISPVEEDVLSALVNLGYQRAAAEKTVAAALKSGKAASFDQLFREALGTLSK